jgi:DNA repair protein RadC
MNYQTALVQLPLVCESGTDKIRSPADAYRVCADIANLAQESFHVLCLNAKNSLLNRHLVTLGLVDSTPVHPREIFREAVRDGASSVVLVHNHPSGDPTPSAEDLRVTRQLIEAGTVLGIKVVDHVIVGRPVAAAGIEPGRSGYLSLRESGLCTFA